MFGSFTSLAETPVPRFDPGACLRVRELRFEACNERKRIEVARIRDYYAVEIHGQDLCDLYPRHGLPVLDSGDDAVRQEFGYDDYPVFRMGLLYLAREHRRIDREEIDRVFQVEIFPLDA